MTLLDDLIEDTAPREQVSTVCVDGALFARLNILSSRLLAEKDSPTEDLSGSDSARELDELLKRAEEKTYQFRFVAIGKDRWRRLEETHAPKKAEAQTFRDRGVPPPRVMPSFWPPAISASLAGVRKGVDDETPWEDVDWDVDKLAEVTKRWNNAQWNELVSGCRLANEEGNTLPKADSAYVRTLVYGGSSGRREESGGLDLSSMADG